jgi:hypothetical protein
MEKKEAPAPIVATAGAREAMRNATREMIAANPEAARLEMADMAREIRELRSTLARPPDAAAEPVAHSWRVGEFTSSANPRKTVLMLAVGSDIEAHEKHHSFIRWVDAAPPAAMSDATKL